MATGDTLSLGGLLFLVGLGGGRSMCRSAKVGSPGFTTVTSSSSGMLVSCGDDSHSDPPQPLCLPLSGALRSPSPL